MQMFRDSCPNCSGEITFYAEWRNPVPICYDCERRGPVKSVTPVESEVKSTLAGGPHDAPPLSGVKHDDGKPPLSLISPIFLEELGKVLGFGAKKYAAHNWRGGFNYSRVISAALRHINSFNNGEDFDPESGLPHLSHAACCLMFLTEFQKTKTGTDDRYKRVDKTASVIAEKFMDNHADLFKRLAESEEADKLTSEERKATDEAAARLKAKNSPYSGNTCVDCNCGKKTE